MKRFSLKVKSFAFILLIAVLLSGLAVSICYKVYINTMDQHYKTMATNIARTAAVMMDGDKIMEYSKTLQMDEDYDRMLDILFQVKNNNECKYLYIQRLSAEGAMYIMDADEEAPCPLGQVDPLAEVNYQYLDKQEQGLPPFITNSEDFGWLVSVGMPIFDSQGQVAGMACVDISMDAVMQDRQEFLLLILMIMLLAAGASAAILMYLVNRPIVSPVNQLSVATGSFVSDRENNELQAQSESAISKLKIRTGDEIENLADAIKSMEKDINNYIENLKTITAEKERIGAELNVATQIQADMLPRIFPPFPDRHEFDIFATMTPAKEVGGDFYDFFLIDNDHLAVVIADVSGKGVPAALFMVIAKTLIKNHAQQGEEPRDVFTNANNQLCEGNETGLFVTAWMGILEISTGRFSYVNAGHNPPLLKRAGGTFEYLRSKAGFVLAGLDSYRYRQQETQLSEGDMLYLYTDGVTEATPADNRLYGEDRLKAVLDAHRDAPTAELLPIVKADIDEFVEGAPQFDDITMLALEVRKGGAHG
jgi:sigma-B regulation protein RsbU (phosphoserine phosphatase)